MKIRCKSTWLLADIRVVHGPKSIFQIFSRKRKDLEHVLSLRNRTALALENFTFLVAFFYFRGYLKTLGFNFKISGTV